MALPPKGDPQRPLHLAIRTARSLGVLFLILGACASVPLFIDMRSGTGLRTAPAFDLRAVATLAFYLAPGVAYLVCSIFLTRRAVWALITTMSIAGVQILVMLFGIAVMLYGTLALRGPPPLFMWIPLLIVALLIGGLGQLEYHLALALRTIRRRQTDEQRGFEPLPAVPVPAPPGGGSDAPSA